METQFMKRDKCGSGLKRSPKQTLNLPDLDHAKSAVLKRLPSVLRASNT